jgi:hypothetical protein
VGIDAGKYAEAEGPSKSDEWFAQGRMVLYDAITLSLCSALLFYADQCTPFFSLIHLWLFAPFICQFRVVLMYYELLAYQLSDRSTLSQRFECTPVLIADL